MQCTDKWMPTVTCTHVGIAYLCAYAQVCVHVHACLCVCVRERERERETLPPVADTHSSITRYTLVLSSYSSNILTILGWEALNK